MADIEELKDEAAAAAAGGTSYGTNTDDWTGAHWQPQNIPMGTSFVQYSRLWYRIKYGDTLAQIASSFGTPMAQLKANNPKTIVDISKIYAGDAIMIRYA